MNGDILNSSVADSAPPQREAGSDQEYCFNGNDILYTNNQCTLTVSDFCDKMYTKSHLSGRNYRTYHKT